MNTEQELFGELHEQEEYGLFGNEHRRQYEAQQEALRLSVVIESLPQDKFCKVCNLPTDGEKCYSKRCPI